MKIIYSCALVVLLSACASTKKEASTSLPTLGSKEEQLAYNVKKYPKDTVALTKLTTLHMQQYEANGNLFFLNQVLTSYEELLRRQPYNYDALLQFYRLNLFKALITNKYDMAHWQKFYQQQPFLQSTDIAPPVYMELLLADKDSLSGDERIDILKKTIKANPNFVNGYLALTAMYASRDKMQLSSFLLETANKYSPNNLEILAPLNEFRVESFFDKLCQSDISTELEQAFTDYKLLAKNAPENAYHHLQLSTVLRLMGRMRMSSFSAKKAASISAEFQGPLAEAQFWSGNNQAVTEYFATKDVHHLNTDDLYLNILFNVVNFNWQQVAALMDEYISRDDISFYGILYGAHAYKMLGQEDIAQQITTKGLAKITLKPWQQQMLNFASQQITGNQLMAESKNKCDASEAHFIQGLQAMQIGKMAEFEQHMTEVVELKIYPFYEYAGAKSIIKRLKSVAP